MSDPLYRATLPLPSGPVAEIEFEYEPPNPGHRLDPDGYEPAFVLIRRAWLDGVEQHERSAFCQIQVETDLTKRPEIIAAVREANKASWEDLFA